jgi:hypothetical protein
MFDQLSAEILASLIKGFPTTTTTTTTTKQNVDPAVHFVYSRVKKRFLLAVNFWPQISSNLGQKDGTLFAPNFAPIYVCT